MTTLDGRATGRRRDEVPRATADRPGAVRPVTAPQPDTRAFASTRAAVRSAWDAPVTSYYLIGVTTLVLVALGLVFVLSSSSIYSLKDSSGQNPLLHFLDQVRFAAIALPLAFAFSRMPIRVLRWLAWPAFAGGLLLQGLLFTPLACGTGGNIAWVCAGPVTIQPSEFVKVSLVLWLGAVLAAKQHQLGRLRHVLLPIGGAALLLAPQIYAGDLGTMLIMGALVAGALWVAGLPLRYLATMSVMAGAVVAFLAVQYETRMARIMAVFDPDSLDPQGLGLQTRVALEALGTGGISGVGLGGSRTKWLYLPAAQNDFIMAIIGEELGLMGTLLILVLFGVLMVGLTRVVLRHPDPFVKIATGAVASWIIVQALVNISVTIGGPVIGVPLPLVSAGGSSLIATLIALGIVLAFARDEPGAREALAARRGVVRRSFGVLARGGRSGR
ncbi:FtsW/RodA/SpoVE family cell cycle protein [Miniimonas sp. S16]|uniref:FtsW/RodA/SpoVE family cell cycle protein n=1 Tax=Miniimonas sp. S16 TaxID=2171623 RepID=UPI001F2A0091|nr:putative peptidoglycan glycosyltransferase FtsW [Miniimonas sp. S16]